MMRGKMPTRFGLVKFERNCNFLFGWTLPWPVFMNHQLFSLLHDCSKFLIFLFTFFPLVLFFSSFPLPLPFPCHVRLKSLSLFSFICKLFSLALNFIRASYDPEKVLLAYTSLPSQKEFKQKLKCNFLYMGIYIFIKLM